MPALAPISDEEAKGYLDQYDTASPGYQAVLTANLRQYQDEQAQIASQQADSHFEKLFTDADYLKQVSDQPAVKAASIVNPYPDAVKYRGANQAYLAHVLGVAPDDLSGTYEAQRDGYAAAHLDHQGPITDEAFFSGVGKQQAKKIETRNAVDDAPALVALNVINAIRSGSPVPSGPKILQDWKGLYPEIKPGEGDDAAMVAKVAQNVDESSQFIQQHGEIISKLFDFLDAANTEGKQTIDEKGGFKATGQQYDPEGTDKKREEILDEMSAIPPEDREKIRGYVALYARKIRPDDTATFLGNAYREMIRSGQKIAIGTSDFVNSVNPIDPTQSADPKVLQRQQIAREIQSLSYDQVGPINAVTKDWRRPIEEGAYAFAEAVPYVGAALIPEVGTTLVAAALTGSEYNRIMVQYPDIDPKAARSMAVVSGGAQTALFGLRAASILGKLPNTERFLETLAKPNPGSSLWKNIVSPAAALNVTEQVGQQVGISLTPVLVDGLAKTLGADMPEFDWSKSMQGLEDALPSTAASMVPWLVLGVVGVGINATRQGRAILNDPVSLVKVSGIDPEAAQKIAAEPDPAKQVTMFQAAFKEVTPAAREAQVAKVNTATQTEQQTNEAPVGPQGFTTMDAGGETVFNIRDEAGNTIHSTKDADAHVLAMKSEQEHSNDANQQAVSALISHFEQDNKAKGRGEGEQTFVESGKKVTALDQVNETPEGIHHLNERIRIAALSDPGVATLPLDQIHIFGHNASEVREGVFHDVSTLHEGADAATVVEERVHGETDRAIHEGRVTVDSLREGVRSVEQATGERLMSDEATPQEVKEAVGQIGIAYMFGRVRDSRLPVGFRGFFRQLGAYFKEVFGRAGRLRKAIAEGKVKGDFHNFIADSVGLPLEAHIEAAKNAELQGSLGLSAEKSLSLGRAERAKELDDALAKVDKDPKLRKANIAKAKKNLWELAANQKPDHEAKAVDATATLEQLEASRASDLADLHQEEQDAQVKSAMENRDKFEQRIFDAKTDATRVALKREMSARESEKKKAVAQEYKAKRDAVESKFKSESAKITRETQVATTEGAQKAAANNQRAELVLSMGKLEAILAILPAEVRSKVSGYRKLSTLPTHKARQKFLVERIDEVGRVFEDFLKKDYRDKIEKLLEKSKPKGKAGERPMGKIGPEAHATIDAVNKLIPMNAGSVEKRTEEIATALVAANESDGAALASLTSDLELTTLFGNLYDKTSAELDAAHSWLEDLYKGGREKRLAIEADRLQRIAEGRQELQSETGKTGDYPEQQAERLKVRSIAKRLGTKLQGILSFEQTLQYVFGKESPAVARIVQRVRDATRTKRDLFLKRQKEFQEIQSKVFSGISKFEVRQKMWALSQIQKDAPVFYMKGHREKSVEVPVEKARGIVSGDLSPETFGLRLDQVHELETMLIENDARPGNRQKEKLTIESVTNEGEKTQLPMSEAQAMNIALTYAQERYREALAFHGWTKDAVASADAFLSPEARKLRDWMAGKADAEHGELNQVFQRMFGMNLPKEKNYWPGSFEHDGETRDMDPYQQGLMPEGGISAGFTFTRKQHKARLKLEDAFAVYHSHASQIEHWRAFAEVVRDLRSTFGNSTLKSAITDKSGAEFAGAIDGWISAFENNGLKQKRFIRGLDQFFQRIQSSQAINALSYNVSSYAKQSMAAFGAMADVPGRDAIKRYVTGDWLKYYQLVLNDPIVQQRMESGYSPEVRQAMDSYRALPPSRMLDFGESGLEVMGKMDAYFTAVSASISYGHHFDGAKKSGMTDAQAHKLAIGKAEETIGRTAQPVEIMDRSLYELGMSPSARFMFMFVSPIRQQAAMEAMAIRQLAIGADKVKAAKDLAKIVFLLHVVFPIIGQTISNAWRDARDDDDDKVFDPENWNAKDYGIAMAMGPASGLPLLGDVFELSSDYMLGHRSFKGGIDSDVATGGKELKDLIFGDKKGKHPWDSNEPWEDTIKSVRKVATAISLAFGGKWATLGLGAKLTEQAVDTTKNTKKAVAGE